MTALLKKRLGIPDMPMGLPYMGGMPAGGTAPSGATEGVGTATPEPEPVVEKTSFDIKLEKFNAAAKLKVIKEVRQVTELGLKEAKELVEKAPVVVRKGVAKEEAEAILKRLTDVGGTCVLE